MPAGARVASSSKLCAGGEIMSRKADARGAPIVTHRVFAIAYLNVVMREADQEELVAALSRIARMCGRSRLVESRLLEKIELSAQALYRALCLRGNPGLKSAVALLEDMGIRLTMQPIPHPNRGNAEGRAALSGPEAGPDPVRRAASHLFEPP
jgi:DNA-binding phage protein